MQIISECGDLWFKHLVGSALINNRSSSSDVDWFNVHKISLCNMNSSDPLFNVYDNRYSMVAYADFVSDTVNDNVAIDLKELVSILTQIKKEQPRSTYSRILSHLYAIKYELITDIKDREAFEFYIDWLKSPGVAHIFWINLKNMYYKYLNSIADNDCNWSQDFDGSDKHIEYKKAWETLQEIQYPTVNKNLGYDSINAKRAFQDLLIIKSILLPNSMVNDEERNFLNRIKDGKVSFDEYKSAKKHLWKQTRLALESLHHIYFLGHGYSLEESVSKKVFGYRGLLNLIDKCTVFSVRM
jgi:hypothetical protein